MMRLLVAKINYSYHQESYDELVDQDPSITVRKYCESEGLNYNTARRYIRNTVRNKKKENAQTLSEIKSKPVRKGKRNWEAIYFEYLTEATDLPGLSIAKFSAKHDYPDGQTRKEFLRIKKTGVYAAQEDECERCATAHKQEMKYLKQKNKSLKNKRIKSYAQDGASTPRSDHHSMRDHDQQSGDHDLTGYRDSSGRFLPGNRFSLLHGGYAAITHLDNDIVETASEIDPLNLANEILTARSQYLSMLRFVAKEREAIIQRYEDDDPIIGFDEKPVTLNKALGDLEYSTAGKLRALEASIMSMSSITAKIQCDIAKINIKDHETAVHSKQSEVTIINKIMTRSEADDWSALQTAKECEKQGVPIPLTILEEMKREIATYEPPIDDDGLSDDDLDKLFIEYTETQSKYKTEELPLRKEQLQIKIEEQEKIENDGIPPAIDDLIIDEKSFNNPDDELFPFDDLSEFTVIGGNDGA